MRNIKSQARAAQPREKLMHFGAGQLSLAELWMCVLGHGTSGKPVQVLAQELTAILQQANIKTLKPEALHMLSRLLSRAQLVRVFAVLELWQRWTQHEQRVFRSPKDALLLLPDLATAAQERVVCLYLSASAQILLQETLAIGSWNTALLQPREIFFPIRYLPVDALVLYHNHPSGKLLPSDQDKRFTKRVQAAANILGIQFYDHLILAETGYFSFREANLLN